MPRWPLSKNERFNSFVDKQENGCWIWTGCKRKSTSGMIYGVMYMDKKHWYAHRASWKLHRGDIPEKLQLNHKCDVPLCVNPDHLYLGTQKENVRDCIQRGRQGDKRNFGTKNGRAKLNYELADEIRLLYSTGEYTQQELADYLNVSQGQISVVIRNERWVCQN